MPLIIKRSIINTIALMRYEYCSDGFEINTLNESKSKTSPTNIIKIAKILPKISLKEISLNIKKISVYCLK